MSVSDDDDIPVVDSTTTTDLFDVFVNLVLEIECASEQLDALRQQLEDCRDVMSTLDRVETKLGAIMKTAKKLRDKSYKAGTQFYVVYDAITDVADVRIAIQQLRWQLATKKKATSTLQVSIMAVKVITVCFRNIDVLDRVETSLSLASLMVWAIEAVIKIGQAAPHLVHVMREKLTDTMVSVSGTKDYDLLDEIDELIRKGRAKRDKSEESEREEENNGSKKEESQSRKEEAKNYSEDSGKVPTPKYSSGAGPSRAPKPTMRNTTTSNTEKPELGNDPTGSEKQSEVLPEPRIRTNSLPTNFDSPYANPSPRINPIDVSEFDAGIKFENNEQFPRSPIEEVGFADEYDIELNKFQISDDESRMSSGEFQAEIDKLFREVKQEQGENADENNESDATNKNDENNEDDVPPRKFSLGLDDDDDDDDIEIEWTPELRLAIGISYWKGELAGTNYEAAFHHLKLALKEKKLEACYYLGKMYMNGDGVRRDAVTAFNNFVRGAESGDEKCFYEVGKCFEFAVGVKRNIELMKRFYDIAVENNVIEAKSRVGILKLYGHLYDQDFKSAANLLDLAAEKYNNDARAYLAVCHVHGIVFQRKLERAKELLDDASEPFPLGCNGHATRPGSRSAIALLAEYHENGMFGKVDVARAGQLYKQLSDEADSEFDPLKAQYARCLLWGIGVPKDYSTGMEILKNSAEPHYADTWNVFGMCYRDGVGVEKNLNKALEYFTEAASSFCGIRGITEAHYHLGEMYENGNGVEMDLARAVHHYMCAANRLHSDAQFRVGKAYETGNGVEKNDVQCTYYYHLAASSGHVEAARKIGIRYAKGLGVNKCLEAAWDMLREASIGGDKKARRKLNRVGFRRLFRRSRECKLECCAPRIKPKCSY